MSAGPSTYFAMDMDTPGSPDENDAAVYPTSDTKRSKKEPGGKKIRACIYCRRSHMVCETERPCRRCVKRGITDLCIEDSKVAAAQLKAQAARAAQKRAAVTGPSSRSTSIPYPDSPGSSKKQRMTDSNGTTPNADTLYSIRQTQQQMAGLSSTGNGQQINQPGPSAWNFSMGSTHDTPNQAFSKDGTAGAWSASYNPSSLQTDMTGMNSNPAQSFITSNPASTHPGATPSGGEFGVLSNYLDNLGIPPLPGGMENLQTDGKTLMNDPTTTFANAFNQSNLSGGHRSLDSSSLTDLEGLVEFGIDWNAFENMTSGEGGKSQEVQKLIIPEANSTERFYLAAADQQSGTRGERLKEVIQAKYEAGLLKPYDYAGGYARMFKWLEKNVSQSSIQAILRPMSVFRPAFRAIAKSLSDLDLIFVEEAFERLMLDYDRVFSAIHTPALLWRRTGEIYKGNKEMSTLTGISSEWFRSGNLGIFQLMDEESIVNYYQLFGSIAFDTNTKSVNTTCVLRIPLDLIQSLPSESNDGKDSGRKSPDVAGPASTHPPNDVSSPPLPRHDSSSTNTDGSSAKETDRKFKIIKCALNFTIRRDSWGMPIAIIGNWIPW